MIESNLMDSNESFFKHFNVINPHPIPVNESIDQQIFGKELLSIRNSKRLSEYEIISDVNVLNMLSLTTEEKALPQHELAEKLKRFNVFTGIIHGDKWKLEQTISEDMGKKIIIIPIKE